MAEIENQSHTQKEMGTVKNEFHMNQEDVFQAQASDFIPQKTKGPNMNDYMGSTSSPQGISNTKAVTYLETYYIYSFDGKLMAEYNHNGDCVSDYIYAGNRLISEYRPRTNEYFFYMNDQINTTRLVTDENGNEVYSTAHGPYGEIQKTWPSTFDPKLKFSGKERESHSELDYFGARYYDHNRYRFSSADPVMNRDAAIANPQLWNLYAYCGNNPITNYDPDGRQFTGAYPPGMIKKTVVLEQMIDTGQSYQDMYLHALDMEEKALNLLSMVINTASGLAKSIFKSGWKGAMQEMGKLAAKKGVKIFTKEMLSRAKKFAWGGGEGKYKFRDASKYAKKYGGKVKDWKKMKSLDANGNEWHWVEHKGKKFDLKLK